jgi:hypothetical protein
MIPLPQEKMSGGNGEVRSRRGMRAATRYKRWWQSFSGDLQTDATSLLPVSKWQMEHSAATGSLGGDGPRSV